MSELTKKLHILRTGGTEEELATIYSTVDECEEPNLKLEVDGAVVYAKLGDMSDDNATSLRIYNEAENQVYAVLSDAIRNYYVDTDGITHFVDRAVVETITKDQYENNLSIAQVNFPSTISVEGGVTDGAFWGCTNLTSADLPNATSLGKYAFYNCTNLISVNLPKVKTLDLYALAYTGLKSVTLPAAIEIGSSAFQGDEALTDVYIPNVTVIYSDAFANCKSLQTITLNNVERIWDGAFRLCTALSYIDFPNVTTLGDEDGAFDYTFAHCTNLQDVMLPKVTSEIYGTFSGCSALIAVELPEVTGIGKYTFANCTSLRAVNIPKVRYIWGRSDNDMSFEELPFYNCTALTSLELPNVVDLTKFVFSKCPNLTAIHFAAANKEQIENGEGYSIKFGAENATIYFDL